MRKSDPGTDRFLMTKNVCVVQKSTVKLTKISVISNG